MPYEIPEGFFDRISGETLQKARNREKVRKKRIYLIRTVAAAAAIIGVVLAGAFFLQTEKPKTPPMVAGKPTEVQVDKTITIIDTSVPIKKQNPDVEQKQSRKIPDYPDVTAPETMENLLASISDEELMQWAMALKNDPIIEETDK
jgi:hypothetical protein